MRPMCRRIVLGDSRPRPPRTRVVPVTAIGHTMAKHATISENGIYRYSLTRSWDALGTRCCFVMLNPSTADARVDDPTIRRCITYAKRWGYGALDVVNLFAFRATNPVELRRAVDPIGLVNDSYLLGTTRFAALVVCAWGTFGSFLRRDRYVTSMLRRNGVTLHALGFTRGTNALGDRQPRHPLYLRADLDPVVWT